MRKMQDSGPNASMRKMQDLTNIAEPGAKGAPAVGLGSCVGTLEAQTTTREEQKGATRPMSAIQVNLRIRPFSEKEKIGCEVRTLRVDGYV